MTPAPISGDLTAAVTPPKMTSALVKAREILEKQGISKIDAAAVKALPATNRSQLLVGFQRHAAPQIQEQYKQLKTDNDKRDWLAAYLLDPEAACNHGVNRTLAIDQCMKEDDSAWMHESEIAGPNGLNCPVLAKTLVESGELGDGRPSEYACFAKMGLKQWWFSKSRQLKKVGHRSERGVESSAELKADEAAEVRDSLLASSSSTSAPKGSNKRRSERPVEDPKVVADRKRRSELRSQKASGLRRLKTLIDKVANEATDLCLKVPSLHTKGYPRQMEEWCMEKVKTIEPSKDAAWQFYSTEVAKVTAQEFALDVMQIEINAIDGEISKLSTKHGEWKKGPVKEVEKLVL